MADSRYYAPRRATLLTDVQVVCGEKLCLACPQLELAIDQGLDTKRVLCRLFQQWPTWGSAEKSFKRLPRCLDA